jgi:integrase
MEPDMLPDDEQDQYAAGEDLFGAANADPRRVPALAPAAFEGSDGYTAPSGERTWQQEMPRWLATMNPGRTQREYEKAVRYFFETPGVPAELAALSFDLLLYYRGSLALRATPHRDQPPAASRAPTRPTLAGARGALPSEIEDEGGSEGAGYAAREGIAPTPLSPATVNVRLTALRQFLVHCALFGWLPTLSPDRIRAALRRLSAERRRPYSVLAEPEWAQFLEAARLPARNQPQREPSTEEAAEEDTTAKPARRGPWGVPRALRKQPSEQAQLDAEPSKPVERVEDVPLVHSRAGLTGVHTAQRDHALLALALATGLRAIELASLDLGDLSREWHAGREEWWLVLPDAKTKGQHGGRTLPIAPELIESVLAYVGATGRSWDRADDRATPLFLSRRAAADVANEPGPGYAGKRLCGRLSPEHIRRIVDRVEAQWLALRGLRDGDGQGSLAADTRAISPHALRHSTAIALLEGNLVAGRPPASVEHVRGWLGHFDIRTTQGYLAHLESRKHRRPFTLAPVMNARDKKDETREQKPTDNGDPADANAPEG